MIRPRAPGRPLNRLQRAVAPDAGRILLRNVYGWFERIEPGLYRLAEGGAAALRHWAQVGDGHPPLHGSSSLGETRAVSDTHRSSR
jgi:hypothetical protein